MSFQSFLEQECICSEVLCFAWPQWENYNWSYSKVLVTSGLLSVNTLFENLKRWTRKKHKPHAQNTCFYHEPTYTKVLKTIANSDKSWSIQCWTYLLPLHLPTEFWCPRKQSEHPSHKIKVKKYTSETAYEWRGIFTKWQHHVESPGADFSYLSTKEIRGSHWESAVPLVAPWTPGPSVLLAAQQACLAKPCWNSLSSSAIHWSLRYLHGPYKQLTVFDAY